MRITDTKEYWRAWRKKNKKKLKVYQKAWREAHPERFRIYASRYKKRHPKKFAEIRLKASLKYPAYRRKYISTPKGFFTKAIFACKRRGKGYSLTTKYLISIWDRQGGRCKLTGVKMRLGPSSNGKIDMKRASIDRVDCRRGYHPGNIRLVCTWVNLARNRLSDSQLFKWCKLILSLR